MTLEFTNRMVGFEFAYHVWGKIEVYFALQTKKRELKTRLKSFRKEGPSSEYLLKIKKVVDSLAIVGFEFAYHILAYLVFVFISCVYCFQIS